MHCRGHARRMFAGCADQRLRLQIDLALTRLRGARRILECNAVVHVNTTIDRSRMRACHGDPRQQEKPYAREPCAAPKAWSAMVAPGNTLIHGHLLRLLQAMFDHARMPLQRRSSPGYVGNCRWSRILAMIACGSGSGRSRPVEGWEQPFPVRLTHRYRRSIGSTKRIVDRGVAMMSTTRSTEGAATGS